MNTVRVMNTEDQYIKLLGKLQYELHFQNNYIKALPSDIKHFIYENEYISSVSLMGNHLIDFVFGKNVELVYQWLYDESSDVYNLSEKDLVARFSV